MTDTYNTDRIIEAIEVVAARVDQAGMGIEAGVDQFERIADALEALARTHAAVALVNIKAERDRND